MAKITPFSDKIDFINFVLKLGSTLSQQGKNFTELDSDAKMNVASKALGYRDWGSFEKTLDERVFIDTINAEYGLSHEFAKTAWKSVESNSDDYPVNLSADNKARKYCSLHKIDTRPGVAINSNYDYKKLIEWLHANSSGCYRPAAEAAEVIQVLVSEIARLVSQVQELTGKIAGIDAKINDQK